MPKQDKNEARVQKSKAFCALERRFFDLTVHEFDEIDSTNSEAKRMVAGGFEGACALLVARTQSAGRGRLGRSFYSPADTGAYFSILYRVHSPLCEAVTVTSAAAVAVMRAVRALTGVQAEIKWVNDLYWNGKKICGILTETTGVEGAQYLIVGIGINICTTQFPADLEGIAGSIGSANALRAELIARVYEELAPYLSEPSNRSWLEDYRKYSRVLGREICWIREGERHYGFAEEIDDSGALLVRTDAGETLRLFSGEISVRTDPSFFSVSNIKNEN